MCGAGKESPTPPSSPTSRDIGKPKPTTKIPRHGENKKRLPQTNADEEIAVIARDWKAKPRPSRRFTPNQTDKNSVFICVHSR
jgi:hypothetical protein